jgi:hypothetical protein
MDDTQSPAAVVPIRVRTTLASSDISYFWSRHLITVHITLEKDDFSKLKRYVLFEIIITIILLFLKFFWF